MQGKTGLKYREGGRTVGSGRVGIVAKRQDRIVSEIEGDAYPAFYNFPLLKQPAGTPTGNILATIFKLFF